MNDEEFIKLINSAIGNLPTAFIRRAVRQFDFFRHFEVRLDDTIKSIPRDYHFITLNLTSQQIADANSGQKTITNGIFKNALKLININEENLEIDGDEETHGGPVIFLNPYHEIGALKALLPLQRNNFFVLENISLPPNIEIVHNIRNAPFFNAIVSRFESDKVPTALFIPYVPGDPVNDWRFFGRQQEIKTLWAESNILLFGGRKLGKSSIVLEFKRQAEARKKIVHYIPCQSLSSIRELVSELVSRIDPKTAKRINLESDVLGINYRTLLLKAFRKKGKRPVLIFDEIGNLIVKEPRMDVWNSLIGSIREITQRGELRAIFTAFHEVIDRQMRNHEGPLTNFGRTVMLKSFSHSEVEELMTEPLKFWSGDEVSNSELTDYIINNVCSHPHILSYLGKYMFERIFENHPVNLKRLIQGFLESVDLKIVMSTVFYEVFEYDTTALMKYTYIKSCALAEKRIGKEHNKQFATLTLSDKDVLQFLKEDNIPLSLIEIIQLLRKMELRGWIVLSNKSDRNFHIVTRVIYKYMQMAWNPLEDLVSEYRVKILEEKEENKVTI